MLRKCIGAVLFGMLALCVCALSSRAAEKARAPGRTMDAQPSCAFCPQDVNVRVEILIEGRPAFIYRQGAYRWLEGRRGQRFAFRLTNNNAFPVGVIPSADGHSLTADGRAGADHPAYVLGPYQSETISVWREDLNGGRQLVFTNVDRSLAALKGDRRNIGVLGVLVWQLEDRECAMSLYHGRAGEAPARTGQKAAPGAYSEESAGLGVGAGERITDRTYLTDRYRRVRVLGRIALYYDDRQGLARAGVDLDQYAILQPDRRQSDPFPLGGYSGVRIPN